MAEQLQQEIQAQYERFIGEFHELTREATQIIELTNQLPERLNQQLLRLQHILGQEYQHIQHMLSETYNLVQHASLRVDEIRHFMHHSCVR